MPEKNLVETSISPLTTLDKSAIDTVRILSVDAVQKANSGHPGTAMALAPIAHVLWTRFMHFDPENPEWPNRDRFILLPAMPVSSSTACFISPVTIS